MPPAGVHDGTSLRTKMGLIRPAGDSDESGSSLSRNSQLFVLHAAVRIITVSMGEYSNAIGL